MKFGEAIEAAKNGKRIQRAGWNGKGMWVGYTPPSEVLVQDAPYLRGALRTYAETEVVTYVKIAGHLDMRAADGSLVIGWLASQTDLLAEDWQVLD